MVKKRICFTVVVVVICIMIGIFLGIKTKQDGEVVNTRQKESEVKKEETKDSEAEETGGKEQTEPQTDGFTPINTEGKSVVRTESLNLNDIETACLEEVPVMENYISEADVIVKGEVIGIEYFDYNGIPWSKLTVQIEKVFSGDAESGQKIVVYVMEGFQYEDSTEKKLVEVSGDDIGLHETGDVSIYVLNKEEGDTVFEAGSYRRTYSCFSEYRYIKSKNKYNVYDSKENGSFGEKKLETRIDTYKK